MLTCGGYIFVILDMVINILKCSKNALNYFWWRSIDDRISLVVQWLRLCTSTSGGECSIPGQRTKIPHVWKKKKNPTCLEARSKCKRKKSIGKTYRIKSCLWLLIKFKTLETKQQHLRTSWVYFENENAGFGYT